MRKRITRVSLAILAGICLWVGSIAQTPRPPLKKRYPKPVDLPADATPTPPPEDTVKVDTNLVTVPVIASNPDGTYVPDITKDEFSIFEDGNKQNIAFFATISSPFHVILMLDTSASTEDKLIHIQRAATDFIEQLKSDDKVKVISFDDEVRDLNEFTSDRAELSRAVMNTHPGHGTRLYDAFEVAMNNLRPITGRKAVVLFTDGVDFHSDQATYDGTLHYLDEEGVIVYPIRFDTRADTEKLAREQAGDTTPQLPTIGVIRAPAPGTTAPTFPSDDPSTVPTMGRTGRGVLGLPSPDEILRGRRNDPYPPGDGTPPDTRNPAPDPRTDPRNRRPTDRGRNPDPRTGPDPRSGPDSATRSTRSNRRADDEIGMMLDSLYMTADDYLKALADKTGGRLVRADTVNSLPQAFANIAAELRTQYSIGYYPTNQAKDGQYRKIKVSSTRKNVAIRARPGYRAPSN